MKYLLRKGYIQRVEKEFMKLQKAEENISKLFKIPFYRAYTAYGWTSNIS